MSDTLYTELQRHLGFLRNRRAPELKYSSCSQEVRYDRRANANLQNGLNLHRRQCSCRCQPWFYMRVIPFPPPPDWNLFRRQPERIWSPTSFYLIDSTDTYDFGGGGSRTPVRKALRTEAYMLISIRCAAWPVRAFRAFARRGQNEQETQPASPMNLARTLRTERLGPAHCVTPLAGPMSKARGSVRLIN